MNSIRKLVVMLGVLLASSSVLVGCSDDDDTAYGALPVNSVVVTGTTASVVWSITPNDNCKGYEVSILLGSRDGSVVASQTFDNRTCQATFSGLKPGTAYVVKTQALPGPGYNGAEVYYREFNTAPNVAVTVSGFDYYEEENKTFNAETGDYDIEYIPRYQVNLSWPAIATTLCVGYTVAVYDVEVGSWASNAKVVGNYSGSATSATIRGLEPGHNYTIGAYAVPNAMCDYANGDVTLSGFTTPAAN